MKKITKSGISLIVLIITIIVIIILAAAIILSISKNNPITNANKAVNENDLKTAQEAVVAWLGDRWVSDIDKDGIAGDEVGALYNGTVTNKDDSSIEVTLDGVTTYSVSLKLSDLGLETLDSITIENNQVVSIIKGGVRYPSQNTSKTEYPQVTVGSKATKNSTITGKNPSYNNPVIPTGFSAKEANNVIWKDENNDGIVDDWDKGLVITDSSENEYVWIPCTLDGSNGSIKYAKWEGSRSTDWTVKASQTSDDSLPTGIASEEDQITKYGGYYVARYEASLPDSETTEELMKTKTFSAADNNRTDIGKAQSKAGKIVWNRIDYNNAKTVSENVVTTSSVQSGLITGKQWDTMLKFIESAGVNVDTDCISWGNYYDKIGYTIDGYYRTQHADVAYTRGSYTKSSNGNLLLETGDLGEVISTGRPKNIYDVAGNVLEWSAETVSEKGGQYTAVGKKILRGGSYDCNGSDNTASYRDGHLAANDTYQTIGFRFVLYIK